MAARFRVKALYEYASPHEDDLNFDVGQIITITEAEDDDWYTGEYTDDHGVKKEGIFPRNFVEKFEPTAPPRPTRSRPKKEAEAPQPEDAVGIAPAPPVSIAEKSAPSHESESEHEPEDTGQTGHAEPERPVPVVPVTVPVTTKSTAEPAFPRSPSSAASPPAVSRLAEASAPKYKPCPPSVSEKPLSNSFKDRIAAFNKPAAPPVAPFKPGGLGGGATGSNFVKKPFVAPPPSRNAYIPPPREKPTTNIYRREEDPEIKEREAETLDQAEKAGLVPTQQQTQEGADDDQPKPTSLKERIALLQKQQMEQAQRHAEAAARKEKAKKPQKKRAEATGANEERIGVGEGPVLPALERDTTAETEPKTSTDDAYTRAPPPPRRRASKGPAVEETHDGSEADMSGAGDTTEGQDDTTEREDNGDVSRYAHRAPVTHAAATKEEDNEDEEEESEVQDDMDPEVRRKEELRARMAKMSGGMGFHSMFGAPAPALSRAPPKKRTSKSVDPSSTAENESEELVPRAQPPPIPTAMALSGMGSPTALSRSHQEKEEEAYGDDNDGDEDGYEATFVPSKGAPPPVPTRAPVRKDDADATAEDGGEATGPAPGHEVACACHDVSLPLRSIYSAN